MRSEERSALERDQWNEDVWTDTVSGAGVTQADALHDPAVWITGLVTGVYSVIKLGPLAISAIAEYFCFDGDCGNEINYVDGVFPKNPSQLLHIFRNAIGHLIQDTPANRDVIFKTISPDNFIKVDRYGNQVFARILEGGQEAWVYVKNGIIQNGGVNNAPLWVK